MDKKKRWILKLRWIECISEMIILGLISGEWLIKVLTTGTFFNIYALLGILIYIRMIWNISKLDDDEIEKWMKKNKKKQ